MPELLAALEAFLARARGPHHNRRVVTMLTWHDDNHLDQLRRELEEKA